MRFDELPEAEARAALTACLDVPRWVDEVLAGRPYGDAAALERAAPGSQPAGPEVAAALAQAVAQLRPAMVLVLGHVAARAALGRPEPLGRLRAEVHQLAGCPAVVTYDPAFLLRSQDNKAAAWADLCRALALVRAQERPSA